jgi:hypothetical protein
MSVDRDLELEDRLRARLRQLNGLDVTSYAVLRDRSRRRSSLPLLLAATVMGVVIVIGAQVVERLRESVPGTATNASMTYPRCADGRPQSEIDAAPPLPLEPQSPRIACVQVAVRTDRSYRLTDGRSLHLYEHVGPLPAKPSRSPTESGAVAIGARSWSWRTFDAYLVLSTDTPEAVYVELGLPTTASRSADIDLLKEIAATLRAPTR